MTKNSDDQDFLTRSRPIGEILIVKDSGNGFDHSDPLHRSHVQVSAKDALTPDFDAIDLFLKSRGINVLPASRYGELKRIIKSMPSHVKDEQAAINFAQKIKYAFTDFIQIKAIVENYSHLRNFPKNLATAFFKDTLIPNGSRSPGRDFLFEHFVGARFSTAGCKVIQYEPDFICSYENVKFGIAAKKLSVGNLHPRISKARDQIIASGMPGIIILDLSSDFLKNGNSIFVSSHEDYIQTVHNWMESNFLSKIRSHWKEWGLDGAVIPAVMAFNIGTYLDQQTNGVQVVVHATTFIPGPAGSFNEKQRHSAGVIFNSIERVRRTLVDTN